MPLTQLRYFYAASADRKRTGPCVKINIAQYRIGIALRSLGGRCQETRFYTENGILGVIFVEIEAFVVECGR